MKKVVTNIQASIRDRLRNKAKETNRSFAEILVTIMVMFIDKTTVVFYTIEQLYYQIEQEMKIC